MSSMTNSPLRLNPHLTFNGECEAAFRYYATCLGANLKFLLKYGDSPLAQGTPPEWHDKILHATLTAGDLILTGADVLPGEYQRPQGFSVMLHVPEPAEAERVFPALAAGGEIQMALQSTFWAARFGMLVDRFGMPWQINCSNAA